MGIHRVGRTPLGACYRSRLGVLTRAIPVIRIIHVIEGVGSAASRVMHRANAGTVPPFVPAGYWINEGGLPSGFPGRFDMMPRRNAVDAIVRGALASLGYEEFGASGRLYKKGKIRVEYVFNEFFDDDVSGVSGDTVVSTRDTHPLHKQAVRWLEFMQPDTFQNDRLLKPDNSNSVLDVVIYSHIGLADGYYITTGISVDDPNAFFRLIDGNGPDIPDGMENTSSFASHKALVYFDTHPPRSRTEGEYTISEHLLVQKDTNDKLYGNWDMPDLVYDGLPPGGTPLWTEQSTENAWSEITDSARSQLQDLCSTLNGFQFRGDIDHETFTADQLAADIRQNI